MNTLEVMLAEVGRQFVDRAPEVNLLHDELLDEAGEKQVLVISGAEMMGKSWLLYRYYQSLPPDTHGVLVDFDVGEAPYSDYLTILADLASRLDEPAFASFSEYVRQNLAVSLDIKLEGARQAEGETSGTIVRNDVIAGRDFIGRDRIEISVSKLILADERRIPRQPHVVRQLTTKFIEDLLAWLGEKRLVFLFDNILALQEEPRQWLLSAFIPAVAAGSQGRVCFVITQRADLGAPNEQLILSLSSLLSRLLLHQLDVFVPEQVLEIYRTYLVDKNQCRPELVDDALLQELHEVAGGRPGQMAIWFKLRERGLVGK